MMIVEERITSMSLNLENADITHMSLSYQTGQLLSHGLDPVYHRIYNILL